MSTRSTRNTSQEHNICRIKGKNFLEKPGKNQVLESFGPWVLGIPQVI